MSKVRKIIIAALLVAIAIMLVLIPPEIKLGIWIKPVLFHGAITWASFVFFLLFAVAAIIFLITKRDWFYIASVRVYRVSVAFWAINFMIWVPLSIWIWHSTLSEPRAIASVWVLLFLGIGYLISQYIRSEKIMAAIYAVIGIGIMVSFYGLRIVLHPLDPVGSSDSTTIKGFFIALAFVCFVIGLLFSLPGRKKELNVT